MVVGYGGSPRATLAGALKIRGRSAANAVMNQEAVTDMVLQEENGRNVCTGKGRNGQF